MTHLQSCYFCGTTGALSEYETLPEETTDEPAPRITLCTRCHTKLTNVLTPILEQTTAASGLDASDQSADDVDAGHSAGKRDDSTATKTDSSPPEVTFAAPDAPATSDEAAATDETETAFDDDSDQRETTDSAHVADADEGAGEHDNEPAEHDDESTEHDDIEPVADESEPVDASVDDADAVEDAEEGEGVGELEDAEAATGVEDVEGADAVEAAGEADSTDEADDAFPPRLERVYHKLLRFLRNREFPIPRAEAETVAQSAYDLSASEASQVLQRAIDKGVLEERGGELHRN